MIELNNVCKSYGHGENETQVLKNVNVTIHRSECVAIMGSSGAGKTSLLHILGLLDLPSSGEYVNKAKKALYMVGLNPIYINVRINYQEDSSSVWPLQGRSLGNLRCYWLMGIPTVNRPRVSAGFCLVAKENTG